MDQSLEAVGPGRRADVGDERVLAGAQIGRGGVGSRREKLRRLQVQNLGQTERLHEAHCGNPGKDRVRHPPSPVHEDAQTPPGIDVSIQLVRVAEVDADGLAKQPHQQQERQVVRHRGRRRRLDVDRPNALGATALQPLQGGDGTGPTVSAGDPFRGGQFLEGPGHHLDADLRGTVESGWVVHPVQENAVPAVPGSRFLRWGHAAISTQRGSPATPKPDTDSWSRRDMATRIAQLLRLKPGRCSP